MIGVLNINGVNLDIDKRVIVPLNYAIADARNPQKRKRNTSEVIALKGTQVNKTFFFSAWNLGASDEKGDGIGFNFDPTVKYQAYYLEKGEKVFSGTASLDSITISKGEYTFNVILYSNVVDVFQILGDRLLSELEWSTYNHTLSVANIQASWSATIGSGYIYPPVDYGFTDNLLLYKTNEFFPHVYWKEVFEKAFEVANLTIVSDFMDTDLFKSLVIGTGGGEKQTLTPTQIAARRCNYSADGSDSHALQPFRTDTISPSYPLSTPPYYILNYSHSQNLLIGDNSIVTATSINDTNAQFDESTGRLTIANTGNYKLEVSGTFPISFGFNGGTLDDERWLINYRFRIRRNGAIINNVDLLNVDETTTSPTNFVLSYSNTLYLEAGDILEFRFENQVTASCDVSDLSNAPNSFDYSFDLNNTFEFDLENVWTEMIDGDTVEVARYLPPLKVNDFLNGVIKAFNLYVGEPNERNEVRIEPLTNFYQDTSSAKVMSDKVDYSKDVKIEAASGIEGKSYLFKFAEDLDHYKKLYFDEYGRHYGDYVFEVPSTFKKGERVYQLPFAQSVPVQIGSTEIIIPRIISFDPINQVSKPYKGKPRVYYYQGLKTLTTDSWELENSGTGAKTTITQHPEFGHLDSRTAPTFDLNFGRPEVVYYTATAYTSNNLFSGYHDQFLRELTGRDSKFLQLYMKLRPSDLQEDFLRDLWNIQGTIYRINQIREYDANGDSTTWTELIRINKGNSPKVFTLPLADVPKKSETFNAQFAKSIVNIGYDNSIPENSKNILIQGDNNTINDGVDNVTLLNTNGVTVTDSGTTIIGGIPISGDGTVKTITVDTTADDVVSWYRVDTSSGNVIVTLPATTTTNKRWDIKKIAKAGRVSIVVSGGGTIDGKTTQTIKNINTSVLIGFNGTNYEIL